MFCSKAFHSICLRNTASPSFNLARNYAFKTDLKVKWIRPEKIPCIKPQKSGDLKSWVIPDQKRFMPNYEKSEELKTATEIVKNMFILENNGRRESVRTTRLETVDLVKRHVLDYGSTESAIAKMTARIRAMQEYMEKFPRNSKEKVKLKELIDKRKRFLRLLRKWDYKRFEWLIEKLDILYKPYPDHFHWITRKNSLKKLCKTYCTGVRRERLDAYRKELEAKQVTFLEDKIKNLEFIRNEQLECKVPVTVSKESLNAVKNQLQELKQKRIEEAKVEKKQSEKDDYELNL